jgi:hypothetical protein
MHAIAELEAAFKYETGTDAEKDGVLRPRILRVGSHYKHLKAIIERFSDPSLAWHELNRLVINFLPPAIAGADILIKLSQLNTFLNTAAWRVRGVLSSRSLSMAIQLSLGRSSRPP